jgi:tRNA (guanosine-2'-O-)-methyltransferase
LTPERWARLRGVLDRRQPDLTVVTDFVEKQRNLAAIVRSCDSVGIMRVHAVIGDEDYRSYRGTAASANRWVEVQRHRELAPTLEALRGRGYQLVAAHLDETAADYRDIDYTLPTALVMGAELEGVSAPGRELADRCISVPMLGMVESLNVSVATAIVLAEARRQREEAGLYASRRIDPTTYTSLLFRWAHPKISRFCDERGLDYPPLDEAGEIIDASGWYAGVRSEQDGGEDMS